MLLWAPQFLNHKQVFCKYSPFFKMIKHKNQTNNSEIWFPQWQCHLISIFQSFKTVVPIEKHFKNSLPYYCGLASLGTRLIGLIKKRYPITLTFSKYCVTYSQKYFEDLYFQQFIRIGRINLNFKYIYYNDKYSIFFQVIHVFHPCTLRIIALDLLAIS